MEKVTVRYARFLTKGSFFAEEWTELVSSADPNDVVFPDGAYAFTMNERVDVVDGDDVYTGKASQIGPMYYHPDSKVVTFDELMSRNDPRDRILLENMRCNGWSSMIYTRCGDWPQPYKKESMKIL